MTGALPAEAVIRTPDRRLRVFVSSTLGELADERQVVAQAISALRLTPVMFESGARPHPPREVYRAYLAQSDVFIGLYWQRYGWVGAGMAASGLEEELELARGLPRLLYIKGPAPDREPRLAEMLARIEQEAADSYRHFRTPEELGRLVRDDLATLLSERFTAATAAGRVSGPRPTAASQGPRPLPVNTTSLVGREAAIDEVVALFGRPEVRLVTLTGPGGVGKTRLAVAVAERLGDRFGSGTVFVPLASVSEPQGVVAGIARGAGADLAGTGAPLEALIERFGDERWLLVLDNLEQVVAVAGDLGELLARCPGLAIVATSRTALGLRAEREYLVPPLAVPADASMVPIEQLALAPGVALYVERARAVRPDFGLTERNAAAVVEICRRLEGLPLAIELAAARTRLLDPDALLRRLARSLDALGTGMVDLPTRQRTLRATVDWSVGLLDDAERSLLETVAVFVDGWTVEAAAEVAGLAEDRALELSEALARHSLIYLDSSEPGPRSRMLETIREFVAERLADRPDAVEVGRRHADYYRTLAERADRQLRGFEQDHWAEQLQAEAGNLATAVGWYLAHDARPLPHLFRILMLFWILRDHLNQARPWIEQLLPTADALDLQDRAELLWTAAVAATELGDDKTAVSTRQRLAALLDGIRDPYLHALSQFATASLATILGDYDVALRQASESLAEFRGQDEPFWTALVLLTVGSNEIEVRRYDDAQRHLRELRDLAQRFDNAWLSAWPPLQLASLALAQGRFDEARVVLNEGLDLSLATYSTRNLTEFLAVYARLAQMQGEPERAALLAGAAEGLRQRVGLRTWSTRRYGANDPIAQAREALGADRFDHVFAAGSRLNQQEAVAAIREQRGAGTPGDPRPD